VASHESYRPPARFWQKTLFTLLPRYLAWYHTSTSVFSFHVCDAAELAIIHNTV
jgi:hypothetical protein